MVCILFLILTDNFLEYFTNTLNLNKNLLTMRKVSKKLSILGSLCIWLGACSPNAGLEIPAVFSDHMVLQHSTSVAFWGKAEPGSDIIIETGWGVTAKTDVHKDSTWLVNVTTIEPGGPYMVTIKNGNKLKNIYDVLLGEVWLASGQSNMEMPLSGWPPTDTIENSASSISSADYPHIRMFTVVRHVSAQPLSDVTGSWMLSTPENAPRFSASAFYFARKLHAELGIPVGIIHSSWGGTPAESWVSGKTLERDSDFENTIDQLKKVWPQLQAYNKWLYKHQAVDATVGSDGIDPLVGLDIFDVYCSNPELNTESWPLITVPSMIEQSSIGDFDGAVWFRKEIEIDQNWDGKSLKLDLGPIDDRDVTYFNGVRIGGMEEAGLWQVERSYIIPGNLVKAGKAVISVRVIDTQGGGGIYGKAEQIRLSSTENDSKYISLAGEWSYMVIGQFYENKMFLFNPETNDFGSRPKMSVITGSHTPSALFNAMIAPLVPYTLKGAIWYQGETNVGRSAQYIRLKSMLINDWREQFKNSEMSFYFVQLAPWHYNDLAGNSSAKLRDAQRRTMAISNTGMAVTLDIGNVDNIHPANKKDVGERLALWALVKNYGKEIPFSGPLFNEFSVDGSKLTISFTNTDGGILIKDQVPNQFEIAGDDGIFYPAKAFIESGSVVLSSQKVGKPVNARYAYKNGSVASLFNVAGLPAASFTTEKTLVD